MIVQRTSVFPADRDTVFQKLRQLSTLQTIARPYATFEPVEDTATAWEVGGTSAYRFRLFGIIPFGTHTIHIIRFDRDGISSREGNEHVPVWNHDIKLRPLDDGRTEYTDRVEIHAGWKTAFVWLWAEAFYAHRQRKWVRLLRQERHSRGERMDFREEYEAYKREHPYREFPVQGGRFRYILSGESGKPAIVFLNGLGMQEAWLLYMIAFEQEYRVLMMDYPLSCATIDALLDAIVALLKELGIERPILVGGSDGGLLAQLFVRRFPGNVGALVLMTTVTIDSKYCEDTNRENAGRYLTKVRLIPYAILKRVLLRLVRTYFNNESEAERAYGTSFLKYIASDPAYKQKYLHAVKLVYDGAKQPKLRTEEFAGLRDRILILHPEKDIFIKEDQQKLTALLADVGAETKTMRGGHLAFVSSPELYIGAIRGFLNRLQLRKDDDNRWTYDDK